MEAHPMKNPYRKINNRHLSLGQLVAIVSSCAKDSKETVAAVADLIASGRIAVCDHGTRKQLKLAPGF
jgi:hypothetical protein